MIKLCICPISAKHKNYISCAMPIMDSAFQCMKQAIEVTGILKIPQLIQVYTGFCLKMIAYHSYDFSKTD